MEVVPKELKIYQTPSGAVPFLMWLESLRDERGQAAVKVRLARLRLGNPGVARAVGDGVQELKINFGPGYRIYFGQQGRTIVVLLCAGDKRSQNEDIKKAKEYWQNVKKSKIYASY